MDKEKVLPPSIGTKIPILVEADLGESHMEDVDFECKFYTDVFKKGIVLKKEDMFYVDKDSYIAIVDTSKIGLGQYWLRLTANIPDPRLTEGVRPEVVNIPVEGINVVP